MSTKMDVLALLSTAGSEYFSGERIAGELGVSRNAVWKAIRSLREDGLMIEAVTNRGYRILPGFEKMTPEGMAASVGQNMPPELFHIYDEIPSTGIAAKQLAAAGAPHGTVVIAETQTQGKGRRQKMFYSPKGGIYFSLILRPGEFPIAEPELITMYAAVCVCEEIEEISGKHPLIKPVNDIFIREKKTAGILTESMQGIEDGEREWTVLGIGLNCRLDPADIPVELRDRIAALFEQDAPAPDRGQITAGLLRKLLFENASRGEQEIRRAYRSRLMPEDMIRRLLR